MSDHSLHQTQHDDDRAYDSTAVGSNPLLLSLCAGLSTCLGASVVFFADRGAGCARTGSDKKNERQRKRPPLSHRHLSFSLALAGSVMVTVSFYSMLPESFSADEPAASSPTPFFIGGSFLSIRSQLFWERVASFLAGCGLYWLLSKGAFPEPDAILGLDGDGTQHDKNHGDENSSDTTKPSAAHSELENDAPGEMESLVDRESGMDIKPSAASKGKQQSSAVAANLCPERLRVRASSSLHNSTKEDDIIESSIHSDGGEEFETFADLHNDNDNDKQKRGGFCCRCNRSSFQGKDLPSTEARRAWRVAMLLFVSLAVHNFPEGFAVAASSMHSPKLGMTTAIAIALHNIPEGIAIAVPCLAARPDSPWLAFGLASLSGLAEPLGAAVALAVLGDYDNRAEDDEASSSSLSTKGVLSFVAGIMVMVAVCELFPEAARHSQEGRLPFVLGTVAGVVIMIGSDSALES